MRSSTKRSSCSSCGERGGKITSRRPHGVYGGLWREARNQPKWRMQWEDGVNLEVCDKEYVALLLSQGTTRFNQQGTTAPFVAGAHVGVGGIPCLSRYARAVALDT